MSQFSSITSFRMTRTVWVVVALVVAFFAVSNLGRLWLAQEAAVRQSADDSEQTDGPQRIVGLSPSNVETLFALGLGDKVVGISRYSSYPPEALDLPRVAGLSDVDFEQVLILETDCVVMLHSQRGLVQKFDELGVPTLTVDHASVEGIITSFTEIADVCGNQEKAREITDHMRSYVGKVRKRFKDKRRPRVLVCIHHSTDVSQPEQIVVAGNAGYHQELIDIAGGVNAYQGSVPFPKLSRENLINLDPDIIIAMMHNKVAKNRSKKELAELWQVYGELSAVKNNRVEVVVGDEHFLPGPRFLGTLDAFAEAIHPK